MSVVGWIDTDTVVRRVTRITSAYNEQLRSEDQTTLGEKTLDAYYAIISALVKRGFTIAQINTWAQRGEYQRDLAAYYYLISVSYQKGDKQDWIEKLNRLNDLKSEDDDGEEIALVDEDGVIIEPAGSPDGIYQLIDLEQINEDLDISLP